MIRTNGKARQVMRFLTISLLLTAGSLFAAAGSENTVNRIQNDLNRVFDQIEWRVADPADFYILDSKQFYNDILSNQNEPAHNRLQSVFDMLLSMVLALPQDKEFMLVSTRDWGNAHTLFEPILNQLAVAVAETAPAQAAPAPSVPVAAPVQAAAAETLIPYGVSARAGRKREVLVQLGDTSPVRMEDRTDVLEVSPTDILFAVYDGHGGSAWADVLSQNHRLLNTINHYDAMDAANPYSAAFDEIDREFRTEFNKPQYNETDESMSGSTATVAHIHVEDGQPTLTLAWVGDSTGVIGNADNSIAHQTRDHSPDLDDERARIEAAGGIIHQTGVRPTGYREGEPIIRVNGSMVSRSFGDDYNKENGVTANPEIYETAITPEQSVLIIASDGLWDIVSPAEAVILANNIITHGDITTLTPDTAQDLYQEGGMAPEILAARTLRDLAYDRGSDDNIAVMVIDLSRVSQTFAAQAAAAPAVQPVAGPSAPTQAAAREEVIALVPEFENPDQMLQVILNLDAEDPFEFVPLREVIDANAAKATPEATELTVVFWTLDGQLQSRFYLAESMNDYIRREHAAGRVPRDTMSRQEITFQRPVTIIKIGNRYEQVLTTVPMRPAPADAIASSTREILEPLNQAIRAEASPELKDSLERMSRRLETALFMIEIEETDFAKNTLRDTLALPAARYEFNGQTFLNRINKALNGFPQATPDAVFRATMQREAVAVQ